MNERGKSGGWEINMHVLLLDGLCPTEIILLAARRICSCGEENEWENVLVIQPEGALVMWKGWNQ